MPAEVRRPRAARRAHRRRATTCGCSTAQTIPNIGLNAVAGRPKEEYGVNPTAFDEMRAGLLRRARAREGHERGRRARVHVLPVVPVVLGPPVPRRATTRSSRLAVVQAYNDWHIDEWCGSLSRAASSRWRCPCCGIPSCARPRSGASPQKGCHSITFTENPATLGLPELPRRALGSDVARARRGRDDPQRPPRLVGPARGHRARRADRRDDHAAADEHLPGRGRPRVVARVQGVPGPAGRALGGRHRLDPLLPRPARPHLRHAPRCGPARTSATALPSDVFREHILTCFIADPIGLKLRDDIGIDNICWEQDYPHSDSSWPNAPEEFAPRARSTTCPTPRSTRSRTRTRCAGTGSIRSRTAPQEQCTVGALRAEVAGHDVSIRSMDKGRFETGRPAFARRARGAGDRVDGGTEPAASSGAGNISS